MGNRVQLLDAIRRGGNSFSKKDLHRETAIAWGTMCKAVDALLADAYIFARKEKPSGPGRPNIPLCLNPSSAYFAAIDIGASRTKSLVCDLAFNIVHSEILPTPRYSGAGPFHRWLASVYDECLDRSGVDESKLKAVGLSVSGNVDVEKGLIVSGGNFGLKWGENVPIEPFAWHCGLPVAPITTQASAAWAEYHFGLHAGRANLVTIGLGVGIGSGVVSNHQLLLSHPGRPVGYIGHLLMPDNPRVCVCGMRGCLEAYSGGDSLAAVAAELLGARKDLGGAEALDKAALEGDPDARSILSKAASYNATGVANMIQLYSPEAIVFSGGQSRRDGFLFNETLLAIDRILPEERRKSFSVSISRLGELQAALGAARLAFEKVF